MPNAQAADQPRRSRRHPEHVEAAFDSQLVRLMIVFACDVLAITLVALTVPKTPLTVSTAFLVPLATLSAFLPAALGAATMWIRRSRFSLAAGTLAAALTTFVVLGDLIDASGTSMVILGGGVLVGQILFGLVAKRLSQRDFFPQPIRLATFALLFKLAIVGLLAAAFVPAERNPLRVAGWIDNVPTDDRPAAGE